MSMTSQPVTDSWWPDTINLLDAALAYNKAGLCVIPLKGKRPALKGWKQYQKTRPGETDIHRWAKEGLLHNVGIVCGEVSQNLVVLDFDGPGAYVAFAALFPSLAQSFTVATGSGKGKHVYLYVESLPITTPALDTPIGHIELRSAGTYAVTPPSIHPVTRDRYTVEKPQVIRRVPNLKELVKWITSFKPATGQKHQWRPPRNRPPLNGSINPAVINAIASQLRQRRHKERGAWINCSCIYPERHANGDRNPSFGFSTETAFGHCYRCGTILARDICDVLGIDPEELGGLVNQPENLPTNHRLVVVESQALPPEPALPALSDMDLPIWLREYTSWASQVGNQTPEIFHLGMGIWMAAVAIARRVYTDARWGVRLYSNLYMMFVADTTFYRKTTAYKLGERILTKAIPHLLMPTPGSPERFQDALAGRAPSNFNELPGEHQKVVLDATRFAAQRGLFKDEIGGLFGAFKRDYMAGLKDFMLEIYDCPDYMAKETQSGLAIIRNAAPSILGVTTPAGLSSAINHADWDNGLLPRFALLTPQPNYKERSGLEIPTGPPESVISGLKALHDALPMPEKAGDGWQAAEALRMDVASWDDCQAYSNVLRQQCDPRLETPLDDRLKGVYGRMHVQAMKVAMICATLDWLDNGQQTIPVVSEKHWQTGKTIAETWRASSIRLLEHLDRSGAAKSERWVQDRILEAFRKAGAQGCTLRSVYRRLNLKARDARQTAQDLVKAGLLVEISYGGAEGYRLTSAPRAKQA